MSENETQHNKIDNTKLILDIAKLLITEHFWGSVFVISLGSILYLIMKGEINLLTFLPSIALTNHHIIFFVISSIILGMIIFISNKLLLIIEEHEFNKAIDKIIIDECKEIKIEVKNLIIILSSLKLMHEGLSNNISLLMKSLNEEIINCENVKEHLSSINSIIHNVPNKETISQLLLIRTRLIYNDLSDVVFDYINAYKNISSSSIITNINKSKLNYIKDRLGNKLNEIKKMYLNDIYVYSKNTFDKKAEKDLVNILDSYFENIKESVIDDAISIEETFIIIKNSLNEFTIKATDILRNNLKLIPIFESRNV